MWNFERHKIIAKRGVRRSDRPKYQPNALAIEATAARVVGVSTVLRVGFARAFPAVASASSRCRHIRLSASALQLQGSRRRRSLDDTRRFPRGSGLRPRFVGCSPRRAASGSRICGDRRARCERNGGLRVSDGNRRTGPARLHAGRCDLLRNG